MQIQEANGSVMDSLAFFHDIVVSDGVDGSAPVESKLIG